MNILELAIARQMSGGGGGGGGASSWDELTGKPFDANNIIKPEALPEGYPYKEGVTIEWDGNTEGLENILGVLYHVSTAILTDEEIKNGIATFRSGEQVNIAEEWNYFVEQGWVQEDYVTIGGGPIWFIRKDNVTVNSFTFEKAGVYFMNQGEGGMCVTGFSTETIHPMAPEFLPAGVGVPTVTADDNGKFLRVVNGAWAAVALGSAEGGSF